MKTNEKLYGFYVGIDISKKTMDVSVLKKGQKNVHYYQFNNDPDGYNLKLQGNWLVIVV